MIQIYEVPVYTTVTTDELLGQITVPINGTIVEMKAYYHTLPGGAGATAIDVFLWTPGTTSPTSILDGDDVFSIADGTYSGSAVIDGLAPAQAVTQGQAVGFKVLTRPVGGTGFPLMVVIKIDDGISGGGSGSSYDLEYDLTVNGDCVFLFKDNNLTADTDCAALAQITDTSGGGNHALQADAGKRAKVLHSVQSQANALLFTRANENHYKSSGSVSVKHAFVLASYHPVNPTNSNAQNGFFDDYNALLQIGADYLLIGEINTERFRAFELAANSIYAFNGRETSSIGGGDSVLAKAQIARDSLRESLVLYEMRNATAWTGEVIIGAQFSAGAALAGRFWNGYVAAIALFSTVQTADTLKKIRRELTKRAGVNVRF